MKVELQTGLESNAVVVPAQSVQVGQQGAYVFVLKGDSTVEQRPVSAGRQHAGEMVILRGLAAGETVVTDGMFRVSRPAPVWRSSPLPQGTRRPVHESSAPFIRRPVMTVLVMLSLLLFGAMAYRRLPVSDLPTVDYPTLQVYARSPGRVPKRWPPRWRRC